MTKAICTKIDRIQAHIDRICEDVRRGDPVQAMADVTELGEIAHRLYCDFLTVQKKRVEAAQKL